METWVIFEEVDKNSKGTQSHSLFSPFTPNKRYFSPKTISELFGKMIVASFNGWLMIVDSNDPGSVFLFNPVSRTTIDLPRLDLLSEEVVSNEHHVSYVMTCVPHYKDDRCVVIVGWKNLLLLCRPGYEDSWSIRHTYYVNLEVESHVFATCNGIIYRLVFLTNTYAILYKLTFDECSNSEDSNLVLTLKSMGQLRWIDLGCQYQSVRSIPHLVELCGVLYCLMLFYGHGTYGNDIQDVRVFKFVEKDNSETLEAVEVESMENQAVFIGTNNSIFGCYVPPTTSGLLQGNCVYILASFDQGVILKFQLHDRTLTPFSLFPKKKVKLSWRRPFWVTSAGKKWNLDESEEKEMDTVITQDACTTSHRIEFGDLPSDLISRIAMRLSVTDYSRFRATCKEYNNLTLPVQSWSSQSSKIEYFETTKSELVLPWLVSMRSDPKICNVIDPMHTDQIYLMTTPLNQSYATMEVVYSKNGWLLMHGFAGNLFFYNPFTKVITGATLPRNQIGYHLRCMGCSATPISQTGIIVGLHYSRGGQLYVNSYIYGDPEWVIDNGCGKGSFIPANNSPVYYKNKNAFYFLDITGRLGRYKITPERRYKWKTFSKPSTPIVCNPLGGMTTYLLECDGEILSVFVSLEGSWVKLFRLDFMKKSWARVDNVKNHMIFLSPESSFAEVAPVNRPEFGNKLYFSRLHEKQGLVCYDLASQIYCSPSNDSMSRENLFQTRELLGCTWIQPSWS